MTARASVGATLACDGLPDAEFLRVLYRSELQIDSDDLDTITESYRRFDAAEKDAFEQVSDPDVDGEAN